MNWLRRRTWELWLGGMAMCSVALALTPVLWSEARSVLSPALAGVLLVGALGALYRRLAPPCSLGPWYRMRRAGFRWSHGGFERHVGEYQFQLVRWEAGKWAPGHVDYTKQPHDGYTWEPKVTFGSPEIALVFAEVANWGQNKHQY